MVLYESLFFILGLILLVKGSDFFVKTAASLAKKLGVSEFIIGLTVIAFGTSIPELTSSIFASIRHESGLITGTIVGANIANIALIIGIAAFISRLKTTKVMLERDGYIMLFSFLLFFVLILNRSISRYEGLFFLFLYAAYFLFLLETKSLLEKYRFREFVEYLYKFRYLTTIRSKIITNFKKNPELGSESKRKIFELFKADLIKDLMALVLSGFFIVIGANYLVDNAVFFANLFNVPATIIGLIIAIGTTMPEMMVAVTAAKKGYGNIAIGNAIGSCISNTFLILGVSALIFPISVLNITLYYTAPFMILMALLLLRFIMNGDLRRKQGIIFLLFYAVFMLLLFMLRFSI